MDLAKLVGDWKGKVYLLILPVAFPSDNESRSLYLSPI